MDDQKEETELPGDYTSPRAEIIELKGAARCISTSVEISDDPYNGDPTDIG
jgi:hypothetical protein